MTNEVIKKFSMSSGRVFKSQLANNKVSIGHHARKLEN